VSKPTLFTKHKAEDARIRFVRRLKSMQTLKREKKQSIGGIMDVVVNEMEMISIERVAVDRGFGGEMEMEGKIHRKESMAVP